MIVAAIESNFNTSAVSSAGAMGTMQIMPKTFKYIRSLCPNSVTPGSNPFNANDSAIAGQCYLSYLLRKAAGDYPAALAGYNAGPWAIKRYKQLGSLPHETANYVLKYLRLKQQVPECGK